VHISCVHGATHHVKATFTRPLQPRSVDILKWDAEQTGEGVAVYVTCGASEIAGDADPSHRWEFLTGMRPPEDNCASALALLVVAVEAEGVGHGHTFEVAEGLWPCTAMNTWLLVSQVDEIVTRLDHEDLHIEFLQAIPMYPEERTWKVVHGVEALLIAWHSGGVEFWNPQRPPAMPSA
jgi:hypothetical protein